MEGVIIGGLFGISGSDEPQLLESKGEHSIDTSFSDELLTLQNAEACYF